jgi:hypothetical protein
VKYEAKHVKYEAKHVKYEAKHVKYEAKHVKYTLIVLIVAGRPIESYNLSFGHCELQPSFDERLQRGLLYVHRCFSRGRETRHSVNYADLEQIRRASLKTKRR